MTCTRQSWTKRPPWVLHWSKVTHFVDGNKRIGHAVMEVFVVLNGFELSESVDEQERAILAVAQGNMSREAFTVWPVPRVRPVA